MKKKAVKHDQLCPFDDHTVLEFFWESRFGVIVVYRWMCHEYRKQNQLNLAEEADNRFP